MQTDKRPVNLNLLSFSFPVTAIASILHRISGVFLAAIIPFVWYFWQISLQSEEGFLAAKRLLSGPFLLPLYALFVCFTYHFLAGLRHLLLDHHYGETLAGARFSAYVLGVLVLVIAVIGGWRMLLL